MASDHLESESIERKARHFVRWNPTAEERLNQLEQMTTFAGHFNPQWKTTHMITNATQLFAALQQHQARYLVIGGIAAAVYGVPRFTYDVDIFIEDTPENIARVLEALIELGSDMAGIVKSSGAQLVTVLEIDDLPVKTDLLVNVPGLAWQTAWDNRVVESYQGQEFYLVGRADLIKAKRAAGRPQDLDDVRALEATMDSDDES